MHLIVIFHEGTQFVVHGGVACVYVENGGVTPQLVASVILSKEDSESMATRRSSIILSRQSLAEASSSSPPALASLRTHAVSTVPNRPDQGADVRGVRGQEAALIWAAGAAV